MKTFEILLTNIISMKEVSYDNCTICHKLITNQNEVFICEMKSIENGKMIFTQDSDQLYYQKQLLINN